MSATAPKIRAIMPIEAWLAIPALVETVVTLAVEALELAVFEELDETVLEDDAETVEFELAVVVEVEELALEVVVDRVVTLTVEVCSVEELVLEAEDVVDEAVLVVTAPVAPEIEKRGV